MSTYFQILVLIFFVPFLLSFHPKLNYYKQVSKKTLSLILVIGFLIVWDIWFTKIGVWSFSSIHTGNVSYLGIPLEEILFFPAVSFSMLLVFYALKVIYGNKKLKIEKTHFYTLSSILFLIGVWNFNKTYTFVVFTITGIAIFLGAHFKFEKISTKAFIYTLIISFIPFLIFNSMLTGEPVVLYDNTQNLGIRIGSIPAEDFIYNFLMIFLILVV